ATGQALRTWTQQTKGFPAGYGWDWGRYANSSMSWLSDGHTLAFDDGINTDRPNGDLLADSKVVYTPASFHACDMMQLTANGKTVVCGYYEGNFAKRSSAFDPKIT